MIFFSDMLDLSGSCLDMLTGQIVRNIMLTQPDLDNSNFSDLLQGKEFFLRCFHSDLKWTTENLPHPQIIQIIEDKP